MEFASNAGLFGRGQFTDRSNLDVVPALAIGALLVIVYTAIRARAMLVDLRSSERALEGNVLRLIPLAFGLQMSVLFAMETLEQIVVRGHALGGSIWLGGPAPISLLVHATVCALVAVVIAQSVRSLARVAVATIRHVRAVACRPLQPTRPIALRELDFAAFARFAPLLARLGERAPPAL